MKAGKLLRRGRRRRSYAAHAVVTGAGSGIGRALAVELARRGGKVVCSDVDLERAELTASLVNADGGRAVAIACDVSDAAQVVALADDAQAWLGKPADLVVNTAGVAVGGHVVGDTSLEDWQWALGINLWGVVHGCHVFLPRLRAVGHGGIINVGSTASFSPVPGMGPYNVSKTAVLALTETIAAELSGSGVVATVLCPTFTKSRTGRDGQAADADPTDQLSRRIGSAGAKVAAAALDAHDRGELYVIPHWDARRAWQLKRHAPKRYTRSLGLLNRITKSSTPDPAAAARPASAQLTHGG